MAEEENRTVLQTLDPLDEIWWTASEDVADNMRLDNNEGGLWSGVFVPPPPRPLFLDEAAVPDGLTTCDLCSWAWQGQSHRSFHHIDATTEAPDELGWVLTLIIVSIISAAVGAIIMITVLHCKSKMKKNTNTENGGRESADKNEVGETVRENHYTHMACEALYAELEKDSETTPSGPAYQNSGYADGDIPTSSAPSSAYYSDLSAPERVYEEVGLASWPVGQTATSITSAAVHCTLPSDYV